ncbi:hypothetical protein PXK56_18250 [Phaeobacter gallaeciensis]|uniref:hypothetical protein n=1 Tax=Phaeobacter gallaeciensis TaxID=60890 RepID=UPI0023809529|nr:hypothetical protein [Phaeobacter gallaeciensis]MDE4297129.1 hypothetical protein [Phaeobacter gallaeciensis]
MTLKTIDEKIDDATHAAVTALGLSVETQPELSTLLNEAIRTWSTGLIADDEDEAASPAPVKTFEIQVGRDATRYYSNTVTGDLNTIMSKMSRHGYQGDLNGSWSEDGWSDYDAIECATITDPDTDEVIARWSQDTGWKLESDNHQP